jgi:hypothetical protein
LQLFLIQQPKLLIQAHAARADKPSHALELVWDPLTEALEPPGCPHCGHPTFAFELSRSGQILCPACCGETLAEPPRRVPR